MIFVDGEIVEETERKELAGRGIRAITFKGKKSIVKVLYLTNNQLTSFSPKVGFFLNLKKLCLHGNQFTSFSAKKGTFPNLTGFSFSYNQLTSFSAEEGAFPNLKELYLSCNQLTSFIAEGGTFPKLKVLQLYNNQLISFSCKGEFPNLKELYLFKNQLTSFSTEEGVFPNLNVLSLYDNPNLDVLEVEAPSLKKLWIKNTNICFLDKSLIKKMHNPGNVQAHYHARGTKHTVIKSQHQGNPIISEIVEHLTR